MTELQDVIETLDNAADSFEGIANKEQKKIYDEVLTLAKDLEIDASGNVKQSIQNLKRLTLIKAKLAALSKNKEWAAGISHFLEYFGVLQKKQNEYYSSHFPEATLSVKAKEKNELMRQMAVQNTIDALMGDGLKANVTDKLNDILLRAVTSGAKFADLQEELRAHLLGKDGGQGAFARYANTYAVTALSQYTGQHNKLLTEGLNTDWFVYEGSNKETTREFCEHLTAKRFIHKSEIPTILTGKIDDYQCAIYPKTGLPYGMIEGTTPDNFQCNCGGWNCRHQLVPVADAVVPKALRDRMRNIQDVQNKLQDYKDKDETISLPTIKGKLLATTPIVAIGLATYEQMKNAIEHIYSAKVHREKASILKSITKADGFKNVYKSHAKKGNVYGYTNVQYDYKNEEETPKNVHLAMKLANSGMNVYLIPNTNETKSADYVIEENGKYYYAEGKVTTGQNAIYNGVKKGSGQSDLIIINISANIDPNSAIQQIKRAFGEFGGVREVWIYKGNVRIVVNRKWVYSKHFNSDFRVAWRQNK